MVRPGMGEIGPSDGDCEPEPEPELDDAGMIVPPMRYMGRGPAAVDLGGALGGAEAVGAESAPFLLPSASTVALRPIESEVTRLPMRKGGRIPEWRDRRPAKWASLASTDTDGDGDGNARLRVRGK